MFVPPRSLSVVIAVCSFTMGLPSLVASQKKTCRVKEGKADCSHLGLSLVPQDLPRNITSLDMSHNRLTKLPPEFLIPYRRLLLLDVSYNSITKLDKGLCLTLPLLQTLTMVHNELYLLKKEDLSPCSNLTRFNIAGNRLKLQGEPFSALQVQMTFPKVMRWISNSFIIRSLMTKLKSTFIVCTILFSC